MIAHKFSFSKSVNLSFYYQFYWSAPYETLIVILKRWCLEESITIGSNLNPSNYVKRKEKSNEIQ